MTWKSRIAALLLALCCLTAALTGCGKKQTDTAAPIDQPTQTQTAPEPVDDYEPTKGDKPYYVRVNLQAGTVTVYSRDESGYYSVPYKAMICSGGESTPRGHFKLTNWRQEWLGLVGDVYGHYCTQIKGNYLFHSVPYTEKYDKNSLQWEEYDRLGTVCSHGCIRLQLIDAKWIYDHMREIEEVELYDSDYPGPLGTPAIKKISGDTVRRGWDPTDPDPHNLWLPNPEPGTPARPSAPVKSDPTPAPDPTPAEPAKPAEPTEPTEPMEPTEPTEPENPDPTPDPNPTPDPEPAPDPTPDPDPAPTEPTEPTAPENPAGGDTLD